MLRWQTLFTELQRFCDPPASVFTGSPTHRVAARHRWAAAMRTYVAEVADFEDLTALAPPQTTLQLGFAGDVEDAFFTRLQLVPTSSARAAAEDFADAWRTGMRSVAGGTGATVPPATSPVYVFAAWTTIPAGGDVVDGRREVLADDLERLFATPAPAANPRLEEIAQAFHRATVELTAAAAAAGLTITYR